jgi:hypothetical protein
MKIDLSTTVLANRQGAERAAQAVLDDLVRTSDSTLLLAFGETIATVSWLDGFFHTLLHERACGLRIAVVTALEDTRVHIDMTLRRRGYAVIASDDEESLTAGNVTILGDTTAATVDAFDVVRDRGEVLVTDIADQLGITVEAAQLRLKELFTLGLVERVKIGKAYAYHLPAIVVRELASM